MVGCKDKNVYLYDLEKDAIKLPGHSGPVNSVAEINENIIASGSWDGTVRMWDLSKLSVIKVIEGFKYATTVFAN